MTYHIPESMREKTPAEIYEDIKRNAPNDILLVIDRYLEIHRDEHVSKETLAKVVFKVPAWFEEETNAPIWLNASRDRNIRDAVADLVTYLHRPIVATSSEMGYRYVTDETEIDKGIADLAKRVKSTNDRISGLQASKYYIREQRHNRMDSYCGTQMGLGL